MPRGPRRNREHLVHQRPLSDAMYAQALAEMAAAADSGPGVTYVRPGSQQPRVWRAGDAGTEDTIDHASIRGDALSAVGEARIDFLCAEHQGRESRVVAVILVGGEPFVPRPDNPTLREYEDPAGAQGVSAFWRPGREEDPTKLVRACPACRRAVVRRWDRLVPLLEVVGEHVPSRRIRIRDRRALDRLVALAEYLRNAATET